MTISGHGHKGDEHLVIDDASMMAGEGLVVP